MEAAAVAGLAWRSSDQVEESPAIAKCMTGASYSQQRGELKFHLAQLSQWAQAACRREKEFSRIAA